MLSVHAAAHPAAGGDRRARIVLASEPPCDLGGVILDPGYCTLTAPDGRVARIEPRVAQVLIALRRAEGAIVTREDLIALCWKGLHVGVDAVSRVIVQARRLGEDFAGGAFTVETLPRVGFRLAWAEVAPVTPAAKPAAAAAPTADLSAAAETAAPVAAVEPVAAERRWPVRPMRIAAAIAALLVVMVAAGWWIGRAGTPAFSVALRPMQADAPFRGFNGELASVLSVQGVPLAGGRTELALGGSIRRDGEGARIHVELVDPAGGVLWSRLEAVDRAGPAGLTEAAARIANILDCTIAGANGGTALPAATLAAFANGCDRAVTGEWPRAIAIARDLTADRPDFAGGWWLRAFVAGGLAFSEPAAAAQHRAEGLAAADRLIALRPDRQDGYALKAVALPTSDAAAREALLRQGTTLRPIFGDMAHAFLGDFLLQVGRFEEAYRAYDHNAELAPQRYMSQVRLYMGASLTGRERAATEAARRADALAPNPAMVQAMAQHAALWRGDWGAAARSAPRYPLAAQEQATRQALAALASGNAGAKAAAAQALGALPEACCQVDRVRYLAALGAHAPAFRLMAQQPVFGAPGARPGQSVAGLWDPMLRGLRSDPAFLPFLERHGYLAYYRASGSRPDICKAADAPGFCATLGAGRGSGTE